MSRRIQISEKLKEEMVKEVYTQKIGPKTKGADFETIKQKLRLRMCKAEIEELCYCLAYTVINAGTLVRLTEVRQRVTPQLRNAKKLTIRGR